jgi:hypothetical protein
MEIPGECRAVGERGKRDTMNSRSCHWLIVSALLITASGAWAQRSAPPAPDQKEQTVKLCSEPPALDEKSIAAFKQQAASGEVETLRHNAAWGQSTTLARVCPKITRKQ